jgi:hypothetical protein
MAEVLSMAEVIYFIYLKLYNYQVTLLDIINLHRRYGGPCADGGNTGSGSTSNLNSQSIQLNIWGVY